jgi:nitronate monooxygenase
MTDASSDFPLPMGGLAPVRAKAEQQASSDFTPFWAGQAAPLASEMLAGALTIKLANEAVERFIWLDGC